eukprot:5276970-Prymnesium_polylepis.1
MALDSAAISLLDLFGFEALPVNSFEQLCINYANESLQAQFNADVFTATEREYAAEGVTLVRAAPTVEPARLGGRSSPWG